jgi:hypothetical protein
MKGFVIAPSTNSGTDHDATGAFHPGARGFCKTNDVSGWVTFNNVGSKSAVRADFLDKINKAAGPWETFCYLGHGYPNWLESPHVTKTEGGPELVAQILAKGQPNIVVVLYSCNTGAPGGFAEWLCDQLSGLKATVFAHLPPQGHAYTCPRVVRYPDGLAYFPEKKDPRYPIWLAAIKDESNYLWARYPFMSYEEVEAEVEAPEHLLGRWEVSDGKAKWDQVFFGDKSVARVYGGSRYAVERFGTWTTLRRVLEIDWEDGTSEAWPLTPHAAGQAVKCQHGGALKACKARWVEALNVNPRLHFARPGGRSMMMMPAL